MSNVKVKVTSAEQADYVEKVLTRNGFRRWSTNLGRFCDRFKKEGYTMAYIATDLDDSTILFGNTMKSSIICLQDVETVFPHKKHDTEKDKLLKEMAELKEKQKKLEKSINEL